MDYTKYNAALLIFSLACCSSYGMWWSKKNIFDAAYDGDVARVEELLDSGTDVNIHVYKIFGFIPVENHPPLYYAALGKQVAVVLFLLNHGAQINMRDYDGFTALHAAASCGAHDVICALIQRGANVNAESDNKMTPLHIAVCGSSVPQHHDSHTSQHDVVWLIDHRARVDAKDADGQMPLHYAARYGNTEAARLLLERGADINAQDLKRRTPLHIAVLANNFPTVKFLVENWADISLQDNDGRTPNQLMLNPVIIQYLESVAADIGRAEALDRMRIRASLPHDPDAILAQMALRSSRAFHAGTQDQS